MSTGPGAGIAQRRMRAIAGPVVRRLWTIRREGYERLPAEGPAILCPNHISFLDSAFLMLTVPRNISFVGKAEYMDSWKTKFLFPAMGMIPIDRSGGAKSLVALEAAEDVLRRGELFGIFPEGTRSRDGYLYRGRTGAARLAMKLDCPIFPVGIVGTDLIQPPDAKLPKPFRECTIKIGRPITPARYRDRPPRVVYRSMMDEVMFEIRELTGQVYRDVYAGQEPESEPAVPARVTNVDQPDGHVGDRVLVGIGSS
ncbi:MAG TPA: lysophospholipid acyltransferase family protein [Ilumatobacteraceae bacterium]|nr:lysophospholipid acyltransferase family protein [Ilumatobacteraceae bacterium]